MRTKENVEITNDLVQELGWAIRGICEELAEVGSPVRRVTFEIPPSGQLLNRLHVTYAPVPVPCPDHPQYKAIRKPRCGCAACWVFYNARRSR